ncbi:PEPxxWA-CTERM sorting domain-containing protein [Sphingomonas abaci]|uniref:PEPxxWA-CTERM sorting domain-containing protein n=1 Tax=Sphingomonas abaci TaxID=237611 RepID=UPI00161BEBE0|nr:PEPxxWA-CTERM sorting domain-containing protein [Sphingomonas abaci]
MNANPQSGHGGRLKPSFTVAALSTGLMPAPSMAATLMFDFSTQEPFAGGRVAFSLISATLLPMETFIQASTLSSFTLGVARVHFMDACFTTVPGSSNSVACDAVEVIVNTSFGSTLLTRHLQDGALSMVGSYTSVQPTSFPGTMVVSEVAGAIPEPTTWVMMLLGFSMVAGATRYRHRLLLITFI